MNNEKQKKKNFSEKRSFGEKFQQIVYFSGNFQLKMFLNPGLPKKFFLLSPENEKWKTKKKNFFPGE